MKLIILVLAVAALAVASPVENEPPKILHSDDVEQKPDGGYAHKYETEKEIVDKENKPHVAVVGSGEYSYPGSDGKTEAFSYFPDETGFHHQGDSIPWTA